MFVNKRTWTVLKLNENCVRVQFMFDGLKRTGTKLDLIGSERFKTRAAHFPIWRDGRTGMQRATLGKSGSEAASQ